MILLWMVKDFLQPNDNKRMEEVGDMYFNKLISKLFFQKSIINLRIIFFVMHGLIRDLAQHISRKLCLNGK